MVKRALALAAVALFATAGVAHAGEYPLEGDTLTVSDSSVEPGQPITISAEVFEPGSSVTFTLFSAPVVLGTAVADANGVATLTATLPSNTTPGTHTIEATGIGADGQPLTVSQSITVLGAGTGAPLPRTGSANTAPMTQVAIAAIAAGGLLVLLAYKRRTAKADTRKTAGV